MAKTDALRPEWLAFEEELGFPPRLQGPTYDDIISQDLKNGQAMMAKYTFPSLDPSIKTSEHKTTSGTRLKSYKAETFQPNQPVVYWIHGGGFALGSVDLDDSLVAPLCKATGCVFVSVEYRLAPAHKYPAALDDCVEGAKWCVENAESLGARKGPIVIAGKSAGGSLVFATALKLIDEGRESDLLGLVPCQPLTVHPDAVPEEFRGRYSSYDENADNTINTKNAMLAFYGTKTMLRILSDLLEAYTTTDIFGAPHDDPYIYCLLHKNLKALPKVYMNACGADTLRDDGRLMKELLDKHEVMNQYEEYAQLPHYFFAYPTPKLDDLRKDYWEKTTKGLLWVLNG
ncbi:hypothetical protein LTR37_018705 [Vermiconidia calcicola]|uniref:Uncharacterized protein n=1 Tax=Vermiconidia calcicola TaxID=1690605 RepID=A0ACC3MHJ0_9PEZI|nr:hypothetical protein LTR37_018705 [Vermiconidia calcicola]